jgi:RimJ/RimL family protein N-acetyltransferase
MLRPEYPIETSRLHLRPFTHEDVAEILAIHSRPDVVRYLYWDVRSEDDVRDIVNRRMDKVQIENEDDALCLVCSDGTPARSSET